MPRPPITTSCRKTSRPFTMKGSQVRRSESRCVSCLLRYSVNLTGRSRSSWRTQKRSDTPTCAFLNIDCDMFSIWSSIGVPLGALCIIAAAFLVRNTDIRNKGPQPAAAASPTSSVSDATAVSPDVSKHGSSGSGDEKKHQVDEMANVMELGHPQGAEADGRMGEVAGSDGKVDGIQQEKREV
jgi:hypothetical protein